MKCVGRRRVINQAVPANQSVEGLVFASGAGCIKSGVNIS